MLKRIGIMTLLLATVAQAKDLSPSEVRERLELRADVYRTDASGEKIISGPELSAEWRPDREKGILKGDWSSDMEGGGMAIRYLMEVTEDGRIKATFEEYGDASGRKS